MYYVDKEKFIEVFNITENMDNGFIQIKTHQEYFYRIKYDKKIYERLLKISKLSYTDNVRRLIYRDDIKKCMKIISYSKSHDMNTEDMLTTYGAKELAKQIDKHILENLLKMSTKK